VKFKNTAGSFGTPRIPTKPLKGRFAILEVAVDALERWLPTYRPSVPGRRSRGDCLSLRRRAATANYFTTAIFPDADSRGGYVRCSEQQFATASAAARQIGLGVLAQVHTHPGGVSLHSSGDDDMVRPRYDGMLSIVVPHYGQRGVRPLDGNGVHQLQHGEWVLAERTSVRHGILIIPGFIDLR